MGVKLKKSLFIIILAGFLCSMAAFAQSPPKDPVEELTKRVESLESENKLYTNNYNDQKERIKEQFDLKSASLDNKFNKLEIELKNDNNYLKVLLWIFGSVTALGIITAIIALIVSFFKIRKRAEEIAEEKIREKFDQIFNEKKNQIEKMIESQNEEFQLKEKKSILVISQNLNENGFMERFFREREFRDVHYETLSRVKDPDKFDLLLFNNEKQTIDHPEILNIMTKTKTETLCFYFGPDRFDGKEFKDRVNFANSRVQLYGNLINSLRYQTLLKP